MVKSAQYKVKRQLGGNAQIAQGISLTKAADHACVLAKLKFEEPYASITHVRVCEGPGSATIQVYSALGLGGSASSKKNQVFSPHYSYLLVWQNYPLRPNLMVAQGLLLADGQGRWKKHFKV